MLQKGTHTVAISFECLPVLCKKLDIQITLQLFMCLSAANICKHNTFSMCNTTVIMSRYSKSINLKTCKSMNLQTIHIYMYMDSV